MAKTFRISRDELAIVRNIIAERGARARTWFEELTSKTASPLSDYEARERVAELGLFLIELASDCERWHKHLGAWLEET